MNKDDDMRDDEQDDETPEEMVNRSLAEALENQQRYMEMFQNSAHMLQVLSRFMADPIVVHDLEIVSDDGTTSPPTTSSTSSPSSASQHTKDNDHDPVVSHRMFGGCADTVTYRSGRLRSARPQRFGTSRHRDVESLASLPRADSKQGTTAPPTSSSDVRESSSSSQRHRGAGDNVSLKEDGCNMVAPKPMVGNFVSSSCQTQTTSASKINVGIGSGTKESHLDTPNNIQRESIGVSTQTSINNAMSEISKAADTIRMARSMLSSLNIGTTSRTQEMNNNNHKETTESDKENDDQNEQADTVQGDIDISRQQEGTSRDPAKEKKPNDTAAENIKSIFVNVKPSRNVSPNNASTLGENPSIHETNQKVELSLENGTQIVHQNSMPPPVRETASRQTRRYATTMMSRIGGVNSNENQGINTAPSLFVIGSGKIPTLNTVCSVPKNNDTANQGLSLTLELFQDALKTAISNLEKDGIWSSQESKNTNVVRSEPNHDCSLPGTKVDNNAFALPLPNSPVSRKESSQSACSCPSRSSCHANVKSSQSFNQLTEPGTPEIDNIQTSVVMFYSEDIASSDEEPSMSSSKEMSLYRKGDYSDVESTFGRCSSYHMSPVLAFHENDNTDDETNTLVQEDVGNDNVGEPCRVKVPVKKSHENEVGSGDCDLMPPSKTVKNKKKCFDKTESPDHSNEKPQEPNLAAVPEKRKKQSFFRRLTSAITMCSSKKK